MCVTVYELAKFRGAEEIDGSMSGQEFYKVGLPMMGGCSVCGATIAAYNACVSKSGYLKCANSCIGDNGYETVEEANKAIFED